jgi:hypothetical protein
VTADRHNLGRPGGTQASDQLGDTRQLRIEYNYIHLQVPRKGVSLLGIQSRHDLTAGLAKHLAQPPDETQVLINDKDNRGTGRFRRAPYSPGRRRRENILMGERPLFGIHGFVRGSNSLAISKLIIRMRIGSEAQ